MSNNHHSCYEFVNRPSAPGLVATDVEYRPLPLQVRRAGDRPSRYQPSYPRGVAGHWRPGGALHLIAHRGASKYARANSPEAVAAAATYGATDVEVDLHSCSDGRFVITHDGTVGATSSRWISSLPSGEYTRLLREAGREPVFLEDIVQSSATNDLGIYLDIKQILPGHETELERAIASFGYEDRVVAASFRSDVALTVKRATSLSTSVLFYDPDFDLNSLVASTGCDFVHPCFDVFPDPMHHFTEEWRDAAQATGAGIITWNTLSVDDAATLMDFGVDGICSDDPAILVEALAQSRSVRR